MYATCDVFFGKHTNYDVKVMGTQDGKDGIVLKIFSTQGIDKHHTNTR